MDGVCRFQPTSMQFQLPWERESDGASESDIIQISSLKKKNHSQCAGSH